MGKFANFFIPRLAWAYLFFVGKTSKIYWLNFEKLKKYEDQFKNVLYAFWHGRQLFFAYAYRRSLSTNLVSQSKDGEYIAQALHLFGMQTVRGSSSRGGGRALIELKRALAAGRSVSVTPDGPRGPQKTIAPGILFLAKKSGKPILPITYSAKRKIVFHGWDDYWVPLPFNSILIHYGNPIAVAPEDDLKKKADELADELNRITQEADKLCAAEKMSITENSLMLSDNPFIVSSPLNERICYLLYNLCLVMFSPIILLSIFLRYPKSFIQHFHEGLSMRIGMIPPSSSPRLAKTIWVHVSSLGECRAAVPLIHAIKKRYPGRSVLFSSMTVNGVAEAQRLHLADAVFYSPLDIPFILNKVFQKVRPEMLLLLESELWPNWLRTAKAFHVKIGIVNGRISEKSAKRYAKLKWLSKILADKIDFVCAREKMDAERFERLGVAKDKIKVTGNFKFDFLPWNESTLPAESSFFKAGYGRIWTAGSIRDGEEALIIDAFLTLIKKHSDLKLILAPRHLEKISQIEKLLQMNKISFCRKRRLTLNSQLSTLNCILWDSFGDLWRAYQAADIVFVGGSLIPRGGQNPIEPAWFAKPIFFGPFMENFAEPARMLLDCKGAIQVQNTSELVLKIDGLLSDPAQIKTIGGNAQKAVKSFFGDATKKTMEVLDSFVQR